MRTSIQGRGRVLALSTGLLAFLVLTAAVLSVDDVVTRLRPAASAKDFLRVTEIMYHPKGERDSEFIELQNIGSGTMDLTGVRFRRGIGFSFQDSQVQMLDPGERVLLVKDRGVFSRRHGTLSAGIGGEYSGRLSNEGETLELTSGDGTCILRFAYNDTWYPSTDGNGHSLIIRDPHLPAGSWSEKEAWRPSSGKGGTPGRGDG
jgi:hypothetical protein